jgi:predicted dinucleotide-binding enzyme
MRVGILGSGDVAKSLGAGFLDQGAAVMLGARETSNPKLRNWSTNPLAKTGTFAEAALFGETIVLATLGTATVAAIQLAGRNSFDNKLVLDATNPLDTTQGFPPQLVGSVGSSGGELIQQAIPDAFVVKCFNTVGHAMMYKPKLAGGLVPDMFICGNHGPAKEQATGICHSFGWGAVDIGDISASHFLESMCMVWVLAALRSNEWHQAFKLLKP